MGTILGLDVGSMTTKAVVLRDGTMAGWHLIASAGDYRGAADKAKGDVLAKSGVSEDNLTKVVVTGYGADLVANADQKVSEIVAHAVGTHHLFSSARTLIEVGGQSTRVAKIGAGGKPLDFLISEKCAAGSGRMLQMIARVLHVKLEDIGPLSLRSHKPVSFTTSCAVFMESEAVSRVAEGSPKEDILAGIHEALASKIANMINRVGLELDCVITGGGARDSGLVSRIQETLGVDLLVPEVPQVTAALGAALSGDSRGN